ncbi:MAG: ABC transporter ATP-binding protein [Candidatus Bipolaricaulota bacterium]|nr:ABC transporter ATP-binding protein [Candidatus Bipolaricaulota bacterium]
MDAIRTSALVKSYERGKVLALNGLDLHVPEGSVFGFLGPNGAGKTTAIKILTGLVEPTSGEAWVAGEPVAESSPRLRSHIGYLSQEPLSEPRILFLDEPCASLDPLGRRDVLEFIARLRGKTTVLMSTHILEDVARVCDTVGIIDRGRMVATAETDELGRRFAPPVVELGFETAAAAAAFASSWAEAAGATGPAATVEGEVVQLRAANLAQARTSALSLVAARGLPLVRLETRAASLEDVFVRLVGGTS